MAGESCCGRLVALFDPDQYAPGEASLAGCAVGYRGRTGKCHCDETGGLSRVELMREDAKASPALDTNEVLLCGPCADSYDSRRESYGCAHCGAAMRQALELPQLFADVDAIADLVPTLYFQMRNYVRNLQILPTHVPTKLNVADLFTKAIVEYQRFDMLRRACGMVESE